MTSLPISIPPDFSVTVKKGSRVTKGEILAKAPQGSLPLQSNETVIDLCQIFNAPPDTVRKYLKKGPGDGVQKGEFLASRSLPFGLKREEIVSHVTGTIIRFERDSGKMFIRTDEGSDSDALALAQTDIVSPLEGTIKVCNNDAIVIESEDSAADRALPTPIRSAPKIGAGEKGSGGKAFGQILVLSPVGDTGTIRSSGITKEAIGRILLLPDIDKEAIAKAAAIGVAGILGTELSLDLFSYIQERKIDLPVISIDSSMGKKLIKSKAVTINGKERSIEHED